MSETLEFQGFPTFKINRSYPFKTKKEEKSTIALQVTISYTRWENKKTTIKVYNIFSNEEEKYL